VNECSSPIVWHTRRSVATPAVGSTWGTSVIRKRVREGQDMGLARYQTFSPYVNAQMGFQRGLVSGSWTL